MDANGRFVILLYYLSCLASSDLLFQYTFSMLCLCCPIHTQFSMPLNSTLSTLKEKINSDPNFGPISPTQQRLFHLGRELKSSNRSLEALGIGRFHVFTLHLHTGIVTRCLELLDSDDDDDEGKQRKQAAASGDDDDDDIHVVDMTTASAGIATTTTTSSNRNRTTTTTTTNGRNRRNHNQSNDNNEVVDLLDDSDSDDDDVIEIVEPATSSSSGGGSNKRRKRN